MYGLFNNESEVAFILVLCVLFFILNRVLESSILPVYIYTSM